MRKGKKVFLYIFFAIISSLFNLSTQRIILSFSKSNLFFILEIVSRTLIGLIVKFILDNSYIFVDKRKELLSLARNLDYIVLWESSPL